MPRGPVRAYGDTAAAGVDLDITVTNKINRPHEIRTVAVKRSLTTSITIQLVVTIGGDWGPFTFVLATGVTSQEWNQLVDFVLPIGSSFSLQTVGVAGGETSEGVVVLEELPM
jgi:hypothetical protein